MDGNRTTKTVKPNTVIRLKAFRLGFMDQREGRPLRELGPDFPIVNGLCPQSAYEKGRLVATFEPRLTLDDVTPKYGKVSGFALRSFYAAHASGAIP